MYATTTTERECWESETAQKQAVLVWVWPHARRDLLSGTPISIGRGDDAAIQLLGQGVSRTHAELYRQGPIYVLRDLGSTNGTWVDGRFIEHAPLAPGNVIRIGQWVAIFAHYEQAVVSFAELAPSVFGSTEMAALVARLKGVADSNIPIAIVGATGTGKERLARAAHLYSNRKGPFVAVNCAALPEHLAEAELFGYRRGAFTGASIASHGHFRAANGGTLFLDELPELTPALQAKLLRIVEDGEVFGLGESFGVKVDVRILCASQTPLDALVQQGKLRQDLAARLGAVELCLPTLAERRADIAPLFQHFLGVYSGGHEPRVEARLVEALSLYGWPNNVRELELMTRSLLASRRHEAVLSHNHLPTALAGLCNAPPPAHRGMPVRPRRDYDLVRLQHQLERNGGNVKAAAEALGVSRQRLYRLLDRKAAVRSDEGHRE